ncbi:hypothetical protein C8R44DRAFT_776622 [Mycena epipterygia]|nr:hypothetical protein C8R44DRAFT_776622 [Mycena epipterygia]
MPPIRENQYSTRKPLTPSDRLCHALGLQDRPGNYRNMRVNYILSFLVSLPLRLMQDVFHRLVDQSLDLCLPAYQQPDKMVLFVQTVKNLFPGYFKDGPNHKERITELRAYAGSYLNEQRLRLSKKKKKVRFAEQPLLPQGDVIKAVRPKPRPLDRSNKKKASVVEKSIADLLEAEALPIDTDESEDDSSAAEDSDYPEALMEALPIDADNSFDQDMSGAEDPVFGSSELDLSFDAQSPSPSPEPQPEPETETEPIDAEHHLSFDAQSPFPSPGPEPEPTEPTGAEHHLSFDAPSPSPSPEPEPEPEPETETASNGVTDSDPITDFLLDICSPSMAHCGPALKRAGVASEAHLIGMARWNEESLRSFLKNTDITRTPLEEHALVVGFSCLLMEHSRVA